jgi:hypothetical protein
VWTASFRPLNADGDAAAWRFYTSDLSRHSTFNANWKNFLIGKESRRGGMCRPLTNF